MIILVDQDNTIADMETAFVREWKLRFPTIPYVDPDERQYHDYHMDYGKDMAEHVSTILHAEGFFRNLPPMEGAIEAMHAMLALGHDVRICTSPLSDFTYCVAEKYQWVDEHLGRAFANRMILTKDKTLVQGDILIDDKPHIVGIATPTWKHVLYDAAYNRNVENGVRLTWKDWKEVIGTLSK